MGNIDFIGVIGPVFSVLFDGEGLPDRTVEGYSVGGVDVLKWVLSGSGDSLSSGDLATSVAGAIPTVEMCCGRFDLCRWGTKLRF